MRRFFLWILLGGASLAGACSSSPSPISGAGSGGSGGSGGVEAPDGGGSSSSGSGSSGSGSSGSSSGGPVGVDTLASNRDRLLGTYLDWLKATAPTPQSNGLSGGDVSDVCDLWGKLDPSAQAVFLTLTARLQGSLLGADGSSMLWHVTKVYRIVGGDGATASDPGSCGGGENNRMIMSMDAALHAAQAAAAEHKGGTCQRE